MQGHISGGGASTHTGARSGLLLALHGWVALPCWWRMAVGVYAAALSWSLIGAGQAWAASLASGFTDLTGAVPALTEARGGAVAAPLPGGQVLIAGGETGIRTLPDPLASAELFDPATDTLTTLTSAGQSLSEGRTDAVAATLPDGEVLIAGGDGDLSQGQLSSAELFNPATDTFTKLTGAGQALTEARAYAVAATLSGGQVLIAGGGNGSLAVSSAELFNPTTDTFTKLEGSGRSPTEERGGAVAATLRDGQVLIAGGSGSGGSRATAELFDPATDTFTKLEGSGKSPTEARFGAYAATLPEGQVLIAGGGHGAELFNPATDTFTKLTGSEQSPAEARMWAVAASLPSGEVLIAGGATGDLEVFNPTTDTFARLTAPQAQIAAAAFGEEAVGQPSAAEVLAVQNVGRQVLAISGATIEGANATDFTVSADACAGITLAFDQTCTISVSFTPAAEGRASAFLTLQDNDATPDRAVLSGTGVAQAEKQPGPGPPGQPRPGPPGEHGPGPQGEKPPTEPRGQTGPTAPGKPKTRAARIELVTCATGAAKSKPRKHCATKLLQRTVAVNASAKHAKALLKRAGKLYATGALTRAHGSVRLVLDILGHKPLPPGPYTLTLSWKIGESKHTSRHAITVK
jgi:Abnormal spindle-like microcephaly-assoc'd, ASPM-SPD-2-Hydin/Kelch motif